jgi:hypothetical protein
VEEPRRGASPTLIRLEIDRGVSSLWVRFCQAGTNPDPSRFLPRDDHVTDYGEPLMRVLFGIVLGVALTVCVAFISDSMATEPSTTIGSGSAVVEHRQMVNWDVVGENMRTASQRIRAAWTRISQKVTS